MEEIAPFGFDLNDLTADWLTKWMRAKGWLRGKQKVADFSCKRHGEGYGFTTIVAAVSFVFSEPDVIEEVPRSVIIKLPKITKGVAINDLYIQYAHREYQFYQYYKTNPPPIRIPHYHYGYFQPNGHFVIIMEDLRDRSGKNGDQVIGLEIDQAREVVRHLARFHASWWNSPLLWEFDWIRSGISSLKFSACMFVVCWSSFLIDYPRYSREISENIKQVGEYLAHEFVQYCTEKYAQPKAHRTLCHGDFRLDNMYFWDDRHPSGDRFCTFDFQVLHAGNCTEDLAYFICTSLRSDQRAKWEVELLDEYFDELVACGVGDYSKGELLADYNEQVVLNIAVPIFIVHQQITKSAKRNPNAKFLPANRMERLFTSWLERSIDAIDSRVPHARDFLDRRWCHVQRSIDEYEGIDGDLKGVLMMAEKFEMQFGDDVDLEGYRADELAHFLRDFYPLDPVGAIVDHSEIDLHFRLLLPVGFEGQSIETINLIIPDHRFVRGVINTENIQKHFLCGALRQPLLAISYPLSACSHHPYPIDRLAAGIRWLRSPNGIAWVNLSSHSPVSPLFRLNLIGHCAGANSAYSLLIRSLTSDFDLQFDRVVLINAALNPACDDPSFLQLNDRIPNWKASSWRALWRAYLPRDLSLRDAADIVEISSAALSADLAAKFPPISIIFTAFDPNRSANEKLVKLLRNSGAMVVDKFIEGAIPQVFSPHYQKGLEIFEEIRNFLS